MQNKIKNKQDLRIVHYENIILTPVSDDNLSPLKKSLGAFRQDGKFVEDFLLARSYGRYGKQENSSFEIITEIDSGIYGGLFFYHYGHFLLESLSRIWCLNYLNPDIPIIWHRNVINNLTIWQKELLSLLNISSDRFIYIDSPMRIKKILLPDPGYIVQYEASHYHLKNLDVKVGKVTNDPEKVWLSRSQLKHAQNIKIDNELEVEKLLCEKGWFILFPEKLTILRQLEILSNAKVIAGFEGSAFHTLILLSDLPKKVMIFTRQPSGINPNFLTIAEIKGINQTVHTINMTATVQAGSDSSNVYLINNPNEIIDIIEKEL
jgi:hypothetical protein